MFRFNSEENPQPEIVKKTYGEFGEKLKGTLAVENNLKELKEMDSYCLYE